MAASAQPQPVAVVIGAGDATGGAIAARFARGGYTVCAVRRSLDKLQPLQTTEPLQQVHAFLRRSVQYRPYDHRLDKDIATLTRQIEAGALSTFVQSSS